MIPAKVKKFLDGSETPRPKGRGPGPKGLGIKYEILEHKTVYTAYDKAATLRVQERQVAKTLVVKLDKEIALAVVPACYNLDKNKLKQAVNASRKKHDMKAVKGVGFAKEQWMKKNIKGIKVGAMPPLGNLFKMATFIDAKLLGNPKIIINSGDYRVSINITPADYKKLVPDLVVGNFGKRK